MKKLVNIKDLVVRYVLLLLFGTVVFELFYEIFGPMTLYPSYFLLNFFFSANLIGYFIYINSVPIEIVSACIAGAAYYLFLILNLSTPNIKTKKRIQMILLSFLIFLIVNILRIFFLSLMYLSGSAWFDFTHALFWYILSTVFVVLIWFWQVKHFKIKDLPFISDIKSLYSISSLKKTKKPKRKKKN